MPVAKDSKDASFLAKYVVENIDTAIESGWIKVYYQPIIRALTGSLCDAESLARWIDPVHGFLSPDKFIGPLEKSKMIYKLDCFIVDQVCRDISDRLSKNLPTVPVSINFSRRDFESIDMLEVVENAVSKYDIPRDYIGFEITESMIVSDAELMREEIERFRNAGYEVWMDDFGSGYSSLTLLKDYQFDTLKLDMEFLANINEKSKAIMISAITMAKNIGVKTLAEGVENEEQIKFLKDIGCGRLQGYYFGKPLPLEDFFAHIESSGIEIEERKWRHFYDIASFSATETDEPLEVLIDDGENFKTLFMNKVYRDQIFRKEYTLEEIDRLIYHTGTPLLKKYREFANTIEKSGNTEKFYYTNDGNILCFKAKVLAENDGVYLIKGSLINISMDTELTTKNNIDHRLKEVNHFFEYIFQMNIEKGTLEPLLEKARYREFGFIFEDISITEKIDYFKNQFIYPPDRKEFGLFVNPATIKSDIEKRGLGYIEKLFRVKGADGGYHWNIIAIMMISGTLAKEYLLCMKAIPEDSPVVNLQPDVSEPGKGNDKLFKEFWDSTINYSSVKFFWKDANRRFICVSKAFLDYFGIENEDVVIGKTDEELGLNFEEVKSMQDELDVLHKGTFVRNKQSQCIVNGIIHNIVINKSPVYLDDKIAGLMGSFVDVQDEHKKFDNIIGRGKLDPLTGLMNVKAFMEALIDYAIDYNYNKRNYGMIVLKNDKYERITNTYGASLSEKLIKEMGEAIVSVVGSKYAIARIKDSEFALLSQVDDVSELAETASQVKDAVEAIRKIDGNGVTLRVKIAYDIRTSEGINDENFFLLIKERLD